jgi:hypothetical protein
MVITTAFSKSTIFIVYKRINGEERGMNQGIRKNTSTLYTFGAKTIKFGLKYEFAKEWSPFTIPSTPAARPQVPLHQQYLELRV